MRPDEMQIEVLPDGRIKVLTDKIGVANHHNAESFLREMARLAGGATLTQSKRTGHGHTHHHDHETH